jgi:patatin-like phospholipase/acyl hydrolase
MYRNLGKKVFGYSFGNYTRGAIRTLQQEGFYNGQQLREIVEQVVGEHVELDSLHDLRVKVFVVSAQKRDGRLGPFIFRTYGSRDEEEGQHHRYYRGSIDGRGITFAQALLATSAAPGYLPSVQIGALPSRRGESCVYPPSLTLTKNTTHNTGEHEFIDGGVVANNPTEIAIFEAMRLWPGRRISVVSLGTGAPVVESWQAAKASKKAPAAASLSSSTLPPMHKSVEP